MIMQNKPPSPASRSFYRLALHTLLLLSSLEGLAATLPLTVTQALQSAAIPLSNTAVVVQGVDTRHPLVRHNASHAMNPASAMKLVTTYAALDLLGPAFTWKTEALADTAPLNGQIDGNLYLRGSGDPSLTQERLWLLLHKLRSHGLAVIDGNLILDRSAFDLPPHDPAKFDNKPLRPYNSGPDALMANLNSLTLTVQPQPASNEVSVFVETPDNRLRLHNRLHLENGETCGDWREKISVSADDETIELSGRFSVACGTKALHLSPWVADKQFGRFVRNPLARSRGPLGR